MGSTKVSAVARRGCGWPFGSSAKAVSSASAINHICWSPDGHAIAFSAAGKLLRVDLTGGAASPICELSRPTGVSATWGSAGDILFCSILGGEIYRVSANGGTPEQVISAGSSSGNGPAGWPCYLPDGKHFLYLARKHGNDCSIMYAAPGAAPRALLDAGSCMAFTAPDLLVYVQEGTLLARRFNWREGRLVGGAFPVADTVRYFLSTGGAAYGTSAGGTLAYLSKEDVAQLTWMDRSGRELGTLGSPGDYLDVCLAPDAKRLLVSRTLPRIGTYDVWSLDIVRGTEIRLTQNVNSDFKGVWLPGGRSIVYSAPEAGPPRLHRLDLDTGHSEVLLGPTGFQMATDISPDQRTLAYVESTPSGTDAAWGLPLVGGGAPTRMLPPEFAVQDVRFSPDGRYIGFISNESGSLEAYVAPYPGPGERLRLSTNGARALRWPRAGNEILYLSGDRKLVSVPVRTSPALQLGTPVVLFTLKAEAEWPDFEVTADGRRILAIVPKVDGNQLPLTVVVHWPEGVGK